MPKHSPFALPRPERPEQVVTLTDPHQPGVCQIFTLRAMDAIDFHVAESYATELMTKYCGENPLPFPPVQGGAVKITPSLCQAAGNLLAMQVGPEEDIFTGEEWMALAATMPIAWGQLGAICDALTSKGPLGKATEVKKEAIAESSDLHSGTPSDTLS